MATGIPGFQLTNSGIGTNTPQTYDTPYQQQYNTNLQNQATGQFLGAAGSAINKVGNFLGNPLPDLKISENLQKLGGMLNPAPVYAADGDLVSALVSKGGYSQINAENAAKGPNAANLRNEFLGGGSQPSNPTSFNIKGSQITAPTGGEALSQIGLQNNDYNKFSSQYSTPQEFLDTINNGYNSQMGFLGNQENALKAASDAYNASIEADYNANLAQGTTSKEKAKGTLKQNSVQAQQRKQDALNSAKQLYEQLQTGYRQRFGGASSAGEASQAILGSEQQRQSGQIGRDYQNTQSQIEAQQVDVENQYQGMIQQLDAQKQSAKRDVLLNTQTQLTQIGQNRVMAEQSKQQAVLQLLMDARDKNFSIDQANRQQAQQLELMKQQALINSGLTSSIGQKAINKNATTGNDLLKNYFDKTANVQFGLGPNNTTKTMSTMSSPTNALESAVGQMSSYKTENPFDWQNQNKYFGV